MTTINDLSFVMIDPNEDLVLPDGTVITGRLERFIYALCCLDYEHLQTPMSRIEEWANALITNEIPNINPQSRAEKFFKAILTGDLSDLPKPQSRSEVLLDKIARGDNDLTNIEPIQSRYELLLAYLVKNGGLENLDYVLYEFQKEAYTMLNTVEKPYKSAILTGQTLVNLAEIVGYKTTVPKWYQIVLENKLKPNTKYFIKLDGKPSNAQFVVAQTTSFSSDGTFISEYIYDNITTFNTNDTVSDYDYLKIHINDGGATEVVTIEELQKVTIVIIEYQDDMEKWDIPYFEGMQSVKMPVLTTTGKNLLDSDNFVGNDFITLNQDQSFTVNSNKVTQWSVLYKNLPDFNNVYIYVDIDGATNFGGSIGLFYKGKAVRELASDKRSGFLIKNLFDEIRIYNAQGTDIKVRLMLSYNAETSYEPYKSNILTVNEDVTLRSNGNVCDELDCLTGELTQRISEIVFNGSENWLADTVKTNTSVFRLDIKDMKGLRNHVICDHLPTAKDGDVEKISNGIKGGNGATLYIALLKTKAGNVNELKSYLSQNPLTVQYQLEAKSIRTVDLTTVDQDGGVLPKPKSYNDVTHVTVSSTDILPSVELEVASKIVDDVLTTSINDSLDTISAKQSELKTVIDTQTENGLLAMMATTEIYEDLL